MPNQANQQKKPVPLMITAKLSYYSTEGADDGASSLAPDLFEQDIRKIKEMAKRMNQELSTQTSSDELEKTHPIGHH